MPLMTGDVCTIYQRPYTITLLRVRIVYFCVLESCPWNASRLRRFFAFIHSRYGHYLTFHDFVFTILIFPLLPYYLTFL